MNYFYIPGNILIQTTIILLSLTFYTQLNASTQKTNWTILNYFSANNNISRHAFFNINGMKRIGSNEKFSLLVQLDELTSKKTLRYKIINNNTVDDASQDQQLGINPKQDLIDAARWAFTNYQSDYHLLVLWNHGNGILDERKCWADYLNKPKTRGILYNFTTDRYLTNDLLKQALQEISTNILHKKIDIIGMDACLMAMVEVAYQIKDSAHYLVASQNIEIAPGWYHFHYLNQLYHQQESTNPEKLAKIIVSSFMLFNKNRNTISTQSVTDLTNIEKLKKSIDHVATILLDNLTINPQAICSLITQAHDNAIAFDDERYIDLASFFTNIITNITKSKKRSHQSGLIKAIKDLLNTINTTVIYSQSGTNYSKSCGLSIYFPTQEIHPSYMTTDFAKTSSWLPLQKNYLAMVHNR